MAGVGEVGGGGDELEGELVLGDGGRVGDEEGVELEELGHCEGVGALEEEEMGGWAGGWCQVWWRWEKEVCGQIESWRETKGDGI